MLTRWNDLGLGDWNRHFTTLHDLRREMDRLFWNFERGWSHPDPRLGHASVTGLGRGAWPRVSIRDTGSELRLWAEVPGLKEQELDITVEQNSLTLRGERRAEAPEGYAVHRQERGGLAFARSFTLPCRVDTEHVSATLKNGVLELTLPKAAEAKPRQIQVKAS